MFVVERGAFALYLWRSFLYGAAVAAAYMLTGLWRIPFSKAKRAPALLLTAAADLFFCLASGFFGVLLVYVSNRGQMRIAALLFFIAGFLLCFLPLHRRVDRLERKILSAVYRKGFLPLLRYLGRRGRKFKAFFEKRRIKRQKKREERRASREKKREAKEKRKEEKQEEKRKDIRNEGLQSSAHTDRRGADHRAVHHHDHRTAAPDE